jgi:hypothetical protein
LDENNSLLLPSDNSVRVGETMFPISPPTQHHPPPPTASPSRFEELVDPSPCTSSSSPTPTEATHFSSKLLVSSPSPSAASSNGTGWSWGRLVEAVRYLLHNPMALVLDRRYFWVVGGALLVWEALVCGVIIKRVRCAFFSSSSPFLARVGGSTGDGSRVMRRLHYLHNDVWTTLLHALRTAALTSPRRNAHALPPLFCPFLPSNLHPEQTPKSTSPPTSNKPSSS